MYFSKAKLWLNILSIINVAWPINEKWRYFLYLERGGDMSLRNVVL
jgi:hypothetical protein